MKQYTYICTLLITFFMLSGTVMSQDKKGKLSERFNVNNDVEIDVDTRYVDVIFETWNKNEVSVEAYVEGEDLNNAVQNWNLNVSGNSNKINIVSKEGYNNSQVYNVEDLNDLNINIDVSEIIEQSLSVIEPLMSGLVGPILESLSGGPLPDDFYNELSKMKFDHEAYRKEGRAYLERWEKEMDTNFGPEFEEKMKKWEKEAERNSEDWSVRIIEKSGIPKWPFGSLSNMTFNSEDYEKNKQAYVNKLNRKYDTKVTVREVDQWLEDVDEWGEDLGDRMEEWGEGFGKSMEKWGEDFGKSMENWGESFGEDMEEWGENLGKSVEKWVEEHEGEWEEQHSEDEHGNKSSSFSMSWNSDDQPSRKTNRNVKRVIKIKMPKKAELDLNVRYGKLKMADVHNAKATVSHGSLAVRNITGGNSSFDVSYSPIIIDNWSGGSLTTSQVKDCTISQAKNISITANSSNVSIDNLNGSGLISGSFGKLSIPKIADNFGSLTIILDNSDLSLKLPQDAFNFSYNGDHNDFILPKKLETQIMKNGKTEMVNGFHKTRSTNNLINISAKYSDVVLQ